MAIPRSVVNTASTLYGGSGVVAKSKAGKTFSHATRELGPIGKRIHSFLQSGPENSLGRRAITTARAVMDYRGRGLARLGDLPQGAETVSKRVASGGRPSAGNPRGLVIGSDRGPISSRTKINIDPSNNKSIDYRVQGYFPGGTRGMGNVGTGGQFMSNPMAAQTIRNRNRRIFGYGAGAAGLGMANASIDRRGYSRRKPNPQPSGRIGTPKGLGRNA
jgi:hypothetical protein